MKRVYVDGGRGVVAGARGAEKGGWETGLIHFAALGWDGGGEDISSR